MSCSLVIGGSITAATQQGSPAVSEHCWLGSSVSDANSTDPLAFCSAVKLPEGGATAVPTPTGDGRTLTISLTLALTLTPP